MKFDYITIAIHENDSAEEITKDICIILNLGGKTRVCLSQNEYLLDKGDVMIVNALELFKCISEDSVYVIYYINREKLQECFDHHHYRFECNSGLEIGGNYDKLKKVLFDILSVTYRRNQYYYIQMNQLFYELVVVLLRNYAVQLLDDQLDKKQELIGYIEVNYGKDLALAEVAEEFHMSKHYFSKYFKKYLQVPFYQYLIEVRLNHALYDVVYSDKKMIQVAMDNGFSNLSSFNHYFKEKNGETPKEHRLQHQMEKNQSQFDHDLRYILENFDIKDTRVSNQCLAEMDSNIEKAGNPYWKEFLHFGNVDFLDDVQIVEHLKSLQAVVGYRYLRIELSDSAYQSKEIAFSRENRWFDFIMDHDLIPWIVIDYRRIRNPDTICDYLENLLMHFVNRYSISSTRKWRVECFYNTIFDDRKSEKFINCYMRIKNILDKIGISYPLMAAGLTLTNREGIKNFYEYLERNQIIIEAQTFQAEPYTFYKNEDGILVTKPTDDINIQQSLLHLRKFNPYFERYVKDAYIVRCKKDFMPFNLLNDSCYKGAFVIKMIMDCYGLVKGLSGAIPFDAMYPAGEQKNILFGGDGVISYEGIHKPSFYALSLMSRAEGNFIYRNENAVFFKNTYGNYHVICHNCKELSHNYYMEKDSLEFSKMDTYFEDLLPLELNIVIHNAENGTYIIKKRTISNRGGSVQDSLYQVCEKVLI